MKTRDHFPPYATDCQRSPWQREIRRINQDGGAGRYQPQRPATRACSGERRSVFAQLTKIDA